MILFYEKFSSSIRWNTIESLLYQVLLIGHQVLLFNVLPSNVYGIVGTIFSSIYVCITVANIGFNTSLAPFIARATSNKQAFKRIIVIQLIPELCIVLVGMFLLVYYQPYIGSLFPSYTSLDRPLCLIIGLIALSESLKKSLRVVLQLKFLNKITALTESGVMVFYVSSVWAWYWLGNPLTLQALFIPMLLTSLFGLAIFIKATHALYKKLPQESSMNLPSLTRRIVHARFFNYATTLSHLIFSGNIIVPFFAVNFGWDTAGIFKLVSTLTYSITTVFNKIFGATSEAMLAHTKEMELEIKRSLFSFLTTKSHRAICGGIIFFMSSHLFFGMLMSTAHIQIIPMIYLFVMLQLSEQFFMVYEKFYITEEKTRDLFIFTFITMLLLSVGLYTSIGHGPLITLVVMLLIRLISFLGISYLSYCQWQIVPSWKS